MTDRKKSILAIFLFPLMLTAQDKGLWATYHENLKSTLRFQIGAQHVPAPKYYKYHPKYRIVATLVKKAPGEAKLFTTFEGTNKTLISFGVASFKYKNREYNLSLFQEAISVGNPLARKYILLPFTDLTNAKTTYGGGRYLQIPLDNIDSGKIHLDFNFAYTPWCAFANDYSCPIPPPENDIDLRIKAGEKYKGSFISLELFGQWQK